ALSFLLYMSLSFLSYFFLMLLRLPRSTLFPYTTLFRSEWINELNVFPVPDGDTGTNMTLTIMSAASEVNALSDPDMKSLAKAIRSEEHTSELQSRFDLVCRLLLEKKKNFTSYIIL